MLRRDGWAAHDLAETVERPRRQAVVREAAAALTLEQIASCAREHSDPLYMQEAAEHATRLAMFTGRP